MKFVALALACAAMVATPIAAQDERISRNDDLQTGTRFKRGVENPDQGKQRDMQKRVARCVVYRNKDLSREFLAKSDSTNIDFSAIDIEPDALFDEFDVADCLGRAAKNGTLSIYMQIPFRTLRNLMAEEVYLMDQKKALTISADAPIMLANRFYAPGNSGSAEVMAELSDCIVYHGAAPAHDFVKTRPGTNDEADALDALYGPLVECAGKSIANAEIDLSSIRTVIADGLWARAHYGAMVPEVTE